MTKDDIIRMAREAGFRFADDDDERMSNHAGWQRNLLERFAALVAAASRKQALEDAIQAAQPEDSYQDTWFEAKTSSVNKIKELLK